MRNQRRWLILVLLLLVGLGGLGSTGRTAAQAADRFFPETNHVVRGRFWQYWNEHGGLAQQGYPISDEFPEVSLTDGKSYTVQYFERAVFEYHPDYAGTLYEVLLSLVGVDAYQAKYPQGAPDQHPTPTASSSPKPAIN